MFFADVVESSVEDAAGIRSLGGRKNRMTRTGRSSRSPELLQVEFCVVGPVRFVDAGGRAP